MICEQCGNKMNYFRKDSTQGWLCPGCGWAIATSYISEIDQDITEYSLFIKNTENINKDIIRLISRIAGVNFLTARQLILTGNVCITRGRAAEMKETADKLRTAGIPFEIVPEFRY